MSYTVAIRKNDTGEVRMCEMRELTWADEDDHDLWFWTKGNFGCDCNRGDIWSEAGGVESDEPCSYGRFSVLHAQLPDGRRIQIDSQHV